MKQELSLEDIRVQSYCSMQRMIFFVYAGIVALWYVKRMLRAKAKRVHQWILNLVCLGKTRPKFILYKFIQALQKLFNSFESAPDFFP